MGQILPIAADASSRSASSSSSSSSSRDVLPNAISAPPLFAPPTSLFLAAAAPAVDELLCSRDSEGTVEDVLEIETPCRPPAAPFDAPDSLNRGVLMHTPRADDDRAFAALFLRSASDSAACACARFVAAASPAAADTDDDDGAKSLASAAAAAEAAAAAAAVAFGAVLGARTCLGVVESLWLPTPWPAPSEALAAPAPAPLPCAESGLAAAPFSFLYSLYFTSIPAATMSSTAGLRPPLAALNDFSHAVISPLRTSSRSLCILDSAFQPFGASGCPLWSSHTKQSRAEEGGMRKPGAAKHDNQTGFLAPAWMQRRIHRKHTHPPPPPMDAGIRFSLIFSPRPAPNRPQPQHTHKPLPAQKNAAKRKVYSFQKKVDRPILTEAGATSRAGQERGEKGEEGWKNASQEGTACAYGWS